MLTGAHLVRRGFSNIRKRAMTRYIWRRWLSRRHRSLFTPQFSNSSWAHANCLHSILAGVSSWRTPQIFLRSPWSSSSWTRPCPWSCAPSTASSTTRRLTCSRRSSWWTTTATAVKSPFASEEKTMSVIVWGCWTFHSCVLMTLMLSCRAFVIICLP